MLTEEKYRSSLWLRPTQKQFGNAQEQRIVRVTYLFLQVPERIDHLLASWSTLVFRELADIPVQERHHALSGLLIVNQALTIICLESSKDW